MTQDERNANNMIDFFAEHAQHESMKVETYLFECKIRITATCDCGSQRTYLYFDSWYYKNRFIPSLTRGDKEDDHAT